MISHRRSDDALADAINWADIVAGSVVLGSRGLGHHVRLLTGKKCVLRLHSIEALQTDFPANVDWSRVDRLITVGDDNTEVLMTRHPAIAGHLRPDIIPSGIDMDRFAGSGDRHRIA